MSQLNQLSMPVQVEQFFERYRKEKSQTDFRFWMVISFQIIFESFFAEKLSKVQSLDV